MNNAIAYVNITIRSDKTEETDGRTKENAKSPRKITHLTPYLTTASHIVLMIMMYAGRIGPVKADVTFDPQKPLPAEGILILTGANDVLEKFDAKGNK